MAKKGIDWEKMAGLRPVELSVANMNLYQDWRERLLRMSDSKAIIQEIKKHPARWAKLLKWEHHKALRVGQNLEESQAVWAGLPKGIEGPPWAGGAGKAETPAQAAAAAVAKAAAVDSALRRYYKDRPPPWKELSKAEKERKLKAELEAEDAVRREFYKGRKPPWGAEETPEQRGARLWKELEVDWNTRRQFHQLFGAPWEKSAEQERAEIRERLEMQREEYARSEEIRRGSEETRAAITRMGGRLDWDWEAIEDAYQRGLWPEISRVVGPKLAMEKAREAWMRNEYGPVISAIRLPYGRWNMEALQKAGISQNELNILGYLNEGFKNYAKARGAKFEPPYTMMELIQSIEQLTPLVGEQPRYLKVEGLPESVKIPAPRGIKVFGTYPAEETAARRAVQQAMASRQMALTTLPSRVITQRAPTTPVAHLMPARQPEAGAVVRAGERAKIPSEEEAKRGGLGVVPEILGLALTTGIIPQSSTLGQAIGAYGIGVAAKSILLKWKATAALAEPLGWAIGLASVLGGFRSKRKQRRMAAIRKRAMAAEALRYQVGYVPPEGTTVTRRFIRRGRPMVPIFPSRMGLAQTTPTPFARI